MRENSFSISSKPDREIVWMPTQNIVFLKLHCSHVYLAHLEGYSRYNLTLNLINCFEFCGFIKVMRCIKYKTALVYKMITIICCTHCDCMLPVRKRCLRFLPNRWCKKVENHWFNVYAGCYLCELCMIFLCSWCPHELGIKCN